MKCRLYPSKTTARRIDNAIRGASTFHNCVLYDMFNNGLNLIEKQDRDNAEKKVHFPDLSSAMSAEYKKTLVARFPIINECPQAALTTNVGVKADLKREFGKYPIELLKPSYYTKNHPRKSYTYQQALSTVFTKENRSVLYITLSKIGDVKIRGWNERLRFSNGDMDFIEYTKCNPKEKITIVVSVDNCGDYWICFKLPSVMKPMQKRNSNVCGVDVGVADIAILSNGIKFENKKFKKLEKKHLRALNRRLSRRNGYSNEEFRNAKKSDTSIQVSNRYKSTKLAYAKLNRKISVKRNYYNNNISKQIVADNDFIGVESLNISGMMRNRHLAYALSDASMGSLLQMLNYKSNWYGRIIQPIDQWKPSSKRCSCCGYIRPKLTLSVREWICPNCGAYHDRDVNAAENIKQYALDAYLVQ